MLASNKRYRVRCPRVTFLRLADSEIHVVCRFLNVTDHFRLGQICRQLHYSCSKPAAWKYVVDERVRNAPRPPASFWAHVGRSVRVLDASKRGYTEHDFVYRDVLARLPALHVLKLSHQFLNLRGLAGLTALQTLSLCGSTHIYDMRPLAVLTSLQTLDLSVTSVTNLRPLAGLTALQTMNLNYTRVFDVNPLAGLTCLQTLGLMATRVADVRPLAGLTALKTLCLSKTGVSDLRPLAGLTSLQTLDLSSTVVSDVNPLAGLTSLQTLDLVDTRVTDVTPLAGLASLNMLYLDPLVNSTALRELGLIPLKWNPTSSLILMKPFN